MVRALTFDNREIEPPFTVRPGRLASAPIQGFWLDAEWLWADPLPRAADCLSRILGGPP